MNKLSVLESICDKLGNAASLMFALEEIKKVGILSDVEIELLKDIHGRYLNAYNEEINQTKGESK